MSDTDARRSAAPFRPALYPGAALVVLGFAAWGATGRESGTALIPAVVGTLLMLFASLRPRLGRPALIAVVVVAALGFLGSLRVLTLLPDAVSGGSDLSAWAVGSQLAMIVVCGFVAATGVMALRGRTA